MKVSNQLIGKIYAYYQASNWGFIVLNAANEVVHFDQNADDNFHLSQAKGSIKQTIPLLAAETLEHDFIIPFFNHNDKIFDVHFMLEGEYKYLILVPIDMLHQQVQFKQQLAHEQVIEKLKLQSLFNTLEDAHDELQKANSAKSFYISALSHEIGNPLTAIKGYSQLLKEGEIEPVDATQIILKNTNKIQQIISQTLDYDKQYNTQFNKQLNPAAMIDDLFNDFKIQAHNKSLILKNQVDPHLRINTNRTKLNQIFTNLISNAIKYTSSGGVTVESCIEDDLLHIDTIDTGCGMSQAFQNQLFTAWSREQKDHTTGNGIGLVIAKMLAEQIGGDLILYSSDSAGSRFRFSVNHQQQLNTKRVLLVDDDLDCLNLFNYHLTQAGHEVQTADSLKAVKMQLENQSFDAIVTDLNLGDGQIDEIFTEIKDHITHKIVMTANPTAEKIEFLQALGFDQVLVKPLNQEQLVNSLA